MKLTIAKQTDFSLHPCNQCYFRDKDCPSYDGDPICLGDDGELYYFKAQL